MINKITVATEQEIREHKEKRINETKQSKAFVRSTSHPDEGSANGDLGMKAGDIWVSYDSVSLTCQLNTKLDNGQIWAVNLTRRL